MGLSSTILAGRGCSRSFNTITATLLLSLGWVAPATSQNFSDIANNNIVDFNADLHGDILLRDSESHKWTLLQTQDTKTFESTDISMSTAWSWEYSGTGDFNNDGRSDVLIRNVKSAAWYVYNFNAGKIMDNGYLTLDVPESSTARAISDFNNDGYSDIVSRDSDTGEWHLSLVRNRSAIETLTLPMSRSARWQMTNAADFDANESPDILLRNTRSGRWYGYLYNGTEVQTQGYIDNLPTDLRQRFVGTGDFNGDGKQDVLLRHVDTHQWSVVYMDGLTPTSGQPLPIATSFRWQFLAINDFNGDGVHDIAIKNATSGQIYLYLFGETGQLINRGNFGTPLPTTALSTDINPWNKLNISYAQLPASIGEYGVDLDGDGFDDSLDNDDDNDGINDASDLYPNNSHCALPSEGNGEACYLTLLKQDEQNLIAHSQMGSLYIYSPELNNIFEFDTETSRIINRYEVNANQQVNAMVYSAEHGRLYLSYEGSDTIDYLNTSGEFVTFIVSTQGNVDGLMYAGNYLIAQSNSYLTTIDINGTQSQSSYYVGSPPRVDHYHWSAETETLVYASPRNSTYYVVNVPQSSGVLTTQTHYRFGLQTDSVALFDGKYIVSDIGIFELNTFRQIGEAPEGMRAALLTEAGELITLHYNGGNTLLKHWNTELALVNEVSYAGSPYTIAGSNGTYTVLTSQLSSFNAERYITSDDADGDGIANSDDDFPTDPAASKDSDGDGFPDAWNTGQSQQTSTTALVLDAFPSDFSCWLSEHATDSGTCDYGANMPNITPNAIFSDTNGLLYIVNEDRSVIYRWDSNTEAYLKPQKLVTSRSLLNLPPNHVEYSSSLERLNYSFADGRIAFIDINQWGTHFELIDLERPLSVMLSTGNFVIAYHNHHPDRYTYIIDRNGVIAATSTASFEAHRDYQWDANTSRIYVGRRNSTQTINYFTLNANTGALNHVTENDKGRFQLPLAISADATSIASANGRVFTGSWDYKHDISTFSKGVWLNNSELLKAKNTSSTVIELSRINDTHELEHTLRGGSLIDLVSAGNNTVLAYKLNDELRFFNIIPNNDLDNDGVENYLDAFPTDAAASVDSDGDGYPDSWNAGQNGNTTTLTLDNFPQDFMCWSSDHDDGQGSCDYAVNMPFFTPSLSAEIDGVIHLVNAQDSVIYRWDNATEQYIAPIRFAQDEPFVNNAPRKMYFSVLHKRFYAGYDNGKVTYIDLATPSGEITFSEENGAINAIHEVGDNLIIAESNYPYAVKLLSKSGVLLSSSSNFRIDSRDESFWDAQTHRLYLFSPNYSGSKRFEYIQINPSSLAMTSHFTEQGLASIQRPIAFNANTRELASSFGHVFDLSTLSRVRNTGSYTKAVWLNDNELLKASMEHNLVNLQRVNSEQVLQSNQIQGNFIDLFSIGTQAVVLTQENQQLVFHRYSPNNDQDGDGFANHLDAFPTDAAASVDTDEDGYPDTWNAGQSQSTSTTNLTLDTFPNDASCWLSSHGVNGNEGMCDYGRELDGVYLNPYEIFEYNNQIHIVVLGSDTLYRWDIATQQYAKPLSLKNASPFHDSTPSKTQFNADLGRLYMSYSSGEINYLDLTAGTHAQNFFFIGESTPNLASAGNYLLASTFDYSSRLLTINAAGSATGSNTFRLSSNVEYHFDNRANHLYYVDNGNLYRSSFNEQQQQFTSFERHSFATRSNSNRLLFSQDGAKIAVSNGDILDTATLEVIERSTSYRQGLWVDDEQLFTVTNHQSSEQSYFERRDGGQILESVVVQGRFIDMLHVDERIVIITRPNNEFVYTLYTPNDDIDGDGVLNHLDAFPEDAAASVDSDSDGFPDAWHSGHSEATSTTGLTLDSFPSDTSCWLEEHATSTGTCDYSLTVPDFEPTSIASGTNGIIYLFSQEHQSIYRWHSETESYLDAIKLSLDAITHNNEARYIAISEAHQRIYVGYTNGTITYVQMGQKQEQEFSRSLLEIAGLTAVGEYLFAQEGSGSSRGIQHTFSENGTITDSKGGIYFSRQHVWNSSNNRLYYTRSGISPNDLHYSAIDQDSGVITDTGESPYHGDYSIRLPIRVIEAGEQILLGSGIMFDATDLSFVRQLGYQITDAAAYPELLIVVKEDDIGWHVDLLSEDDLSLINRSRFDNTIIGIQLIGDDIVVILNDGGIVFTKLHLGDEDADGLPAWWETKYDLSDNNANDASQDSDGDTLTNLQEYIAGTSPRLVDTDGDSLDDAAEISTHQTNPTKSDTDGDGLSDSEEINQYETNPLTADSDGDGFSDYSEVLVYGSDPNDIDSVPESISHLQEGFETDSISALFSAKDGTDAEWLISDKQSSEGNQSLRSGDIEDRQSSSIILTGLFATGTLSFDALVSSENCCDRLFVYLNGEQVFNLSSDSWQSVNIELSEGEHNIEWRYAKDSSVSRADDSAYIDNITFTVNN